MKRSRSCSSDILHSKRYKSTSPVEHLTIEALAEHDRNTPPLPPFALFSVAPEENLGSLSDVPSLPPPSTRSSQQSRSSSPSRRSDAQYRVGPLRRANIYVDAEVPDDIEHHTDSRIFCALDNDDDNLRQVSEKLWRTSKELVTTPSGKTEWTEALYTAINELRPAGLQIVYNQDWREDLKPPVHRPLPSIPRKRNQSHRSPPGNIVSDRLHPSPQSPNPMEPATPIFKLKDPRPDMCRLISDPYVTPSDLRFPFLIIEVKASATGGNLYQAQNQAAVGGSTALQILNNLSDLRNTHGFDDNTQENIEGSTGAGRTMPDVILNLAFSITTEGPIHELWLHFQRPEEEDFDMVCLGVWRTTLKDGSLNLLRHLLAILRWGNGEFKDQIVAALQCL
ncbi:hypothetical protein DTO271D3_1134 [Paecilomyces variotii]|nr:hypothetical protein DTO271D3_1134 [Paecilomyces variotii]